MRREIPNAADNKIHIGPSGGGIPNAYNNNNNDGEAHHTVVIAAIKRPK